MQRNRSERMKVVEQLRYVRLGTRNLTAAKDFAQRVLGLQLVDETAGAAYFRSCNRDHTLVFHDGDPADQAVGFEIHGEDTFDATIAALRQAGVAVTTGDATASAARKARRLAIFRDPGGNAIEIVVRPLNSGWRFHGARDSGVTGLAGVSLRTPRAAECERLWTTHLGARVSDWAGEAAFLAIDDAHHRLVYYPSQRHGILAVEYEVENVDLVMRNSYFAQSAQVRIVHGPGRRPTSNQIFLTCVGPDGVLFSFVAEGSKPAPGQRARQFADEPLTHCNWGSPCDIPDLKGRQS